MEEINLREYQIGGIESVRALYRDGKRRVLLVAPTGAGKTKIAAYLMREAGRKKTRTAFVVDRVTLVDQTSGVLDVHGIDHGVIQAGHWRNRMYEPLQVCSAQTLEKRGFFPDLSFLVVDEAHCMRAQTTKLIQNAADLRTLGLTATPFAEGMGQLYDGFVNVTTTNKLIDEGFLVPVKMFAAVRPDMHGAKVVGGEWAEKEIEQRGLTILGDIVGEWESKTTEFFGGPVKTLVFSATVEHGKALCEAFNRAGHNFQQLSYLDGSSDTRREIVEEFRKSDSAITGLISCEVLTKGFDCPDVMCGISARPYRKSFSSHIQQLGRVMRPSPGKEFALWLDHSGNAARFLADQVDLFENGVTSLEDASNPDKKKRKENDTEEAEEVCRCPMCRAIMPPRASRCPSCGHERPRVANVDEAAGVMVSINGHQVPATGKHEHLQDKDAVFAGLKHMAMLRKRGDNDEARKWAQRQFLSIYGEFAFRKWENVTPAAPTPQLASLVTSMMIRFAKARAAA